jgi:uncharacterized membrane protein YadS
MAEADPTEAELVSAPPWTWRELVASEDWLANWLGLGLLALFLAIASIRAIPDEQIKTLFAKPEKWRDNPVESVLGEGKEGVLGGVVLAFAASLTAFGLGVRAMGRPAGRFARGFVGLFLLAGLAYVLAEQVVVKYYNLEYAVWALALGLAVSHTVGAPRWIRPALCTEFFIKTGLVVYGSGVLLGELLALAAPGIGVAWVVTPIVLVSTYVIGQRIVRLPSKTLNITLSADMSVCGVSAAIATAAACRAKREELSLAIGVSLSFTAVMMLAMPVVVRATGMHPVVGGAWIGGTIDATGAVAVAGAALGKAGGDAAVTIKMIQNTLIGVIAFGVAVYWVAVVERDAGRPAVGPGEIWRRLPKFILGFLFVSVLFTILAGFDADLVRRSAWLAKPVREWFFCLAFVSIGLETNFRDLASHLRGGKPVLLYVVGQSINLLLTLFMAWLMFSVVFPDAKGVFSAR